MRPTLLLLVTALLAGHPLPARGQGQTVVPQSTPSDEDKTAMRTPTWCRDATTICWSETRAMFAGIRFVFEPQLGVLIQNGEDKFDNANFRALEKVGVATTLAGRWIGLQALFIYPSAVQFDEQSPSRTNGRVVDAEGKVDVEWGGTVGVTFLDGIISVGIGMLRYDERDFVGSQGLDRSTFRDSFTYVNFQAVEAIKGAIKSFRK